MPEIPQTEIESRRQKLADLLPINTAYIVLANSVLTRNNDVEHIFRQNSSFWYFTGFNEPEAAFILIKKVNSFETHLFCREKDKQKEIWTGQRLGLEQAKIVTKVDSVHHFLEETFLDFLKKQNLFEIYLETDSNGLKSQFDWQQKITALVKKVQNGTELTDKLRLFKSPWEIEQMQKSAKIALSAHQNVLNFVKDKRSEMYEYQLEAILQYTFKSNNVNWSYPPIVASGANSTTLHYVKNNAKIRPDKNWILIDSGCEYNYYASDITRTIFTKLPTGLTKQVYDLVEQTQIKCIQFVQKNFGKKPITLTDIHQIAVTCLSRGLLDLGILKGNLAELIDQKAYQKYYMHGTSHYLGLDVHDSGKYKDANQKPVVLENGMCFTIEPGLYFDLQDESVPAEIRGLGIRIEDDVFLQSDKVTTTTNL